MQNENFQKIVEELISSTGFHMGDVSSAWSDEDGAWWYAVRSDDSRYLIGRDGETLEALNHLVRKIIETSMKGGETEGEIAVPMVTIDVNGFQRKKNENLKTIAHMMAERARFFKASVEVDPMSSYERKVIHTFLQNAKDIKTESTGVGRDRRVVISYKEAEEHKNI